MSKPDYVESRALMAVWVSKMLTLPHIPFKSWAFILCPLQTEGPFSVSYHFLGSIFYFCFVAAQLPYPRMHQKVHHQISIDYVTRDNLLTLRIIFNFFLSTVFFIDSISLRLRGIDYCLPVFDLTPAFRGDVGVFLGAFTSCIQLVDIPGRKSGFSSHLCGKSGLNSSYYLPPFAHL